eukprot:gnl/TRDRNA2_/TRDRNA2_173440_c1_seq5.p1 gnl/TRDRNA2_/TRDRNA2_173440_c1~~gnl/TRDRNA2_/TRDRNA2_173440_c1_seq5.p1  ORF type:complete len:510 (+),score=66.17 gnl/TRDRNA2_/TRDRNA2_173440_c1_seq5:66-1595(+)
MSATVEGADAAEKQDSKMEEMPEQPVSCWMKMRVAMIWLCCCLASSSILPIWPVVQPSLAAAGVFVDVCESSSKTADGSHSEAGSGAKCDAQSAVLSNAGIIGTSAYLVGSWPGGLAFDILGPRGCTTTGSLMCCAGAVAIAVTSCKPHSFSWMLYPGILLSSFGSIFNSFGIFGFLWHMPTRQGFLIGLSNSCFAVSSLVPLVLVSFVPFVMALFIISGLGAFSILLSFCFTPSSQEYRSKAEEVLGLPQEPPQFALLPVLRTCYRLIQVRRKDHAFFFASLLSLACQWQYFTGIASPFLTAFLGSAAAAAEVNNFGTSLYGILGFFLAPLGGFVADKYGFTALAAFVTALIVLMTPPLFVPTVPAQFVSTAIFTVMSVMQTTYFTRWFTLYAPPNHFGNFQGFILTASGLFGLLLCSILEFVSESYLHGLMRFLLPLAALSTANVLTAGAFYLHIRKVTLPSVPPAVDEESDNTVELAYQSVPAGKDKSEVLLVTPRSVEPVTQRSE